MADSALAAVDAFIEQQAVDSDAKNWRSGLTEPPTLDFDSGQTYFWDLKTSVGDVRVRLLTDTAPIHVSSTIYLTRLGFYDSLRFHRVISEFMAQGGCPLGTGTGGPGYEYAGEFDPAVKHDKPGLLSMANAGPGTDGSQFFLTFVPTPWLDGKHSIFGEVVEGLDTLKALEALGSQSGDTSQPVSIESATIRVE